MQISGRFNIGQNFDFYIISAIRDYFGGNVKILTIPSPWGEGMGKGTKKDVAPL